MPTQRSRSSREERKVNGCHRATMRMPTTPTCPRGRPLSQAGSHLPNTIRYRRIRDRTATPEQARCPRIRPCRATPPSRHRSLRLTQLTMPCPKLPNRRNPRVPTMPSISHRRRHHQSRKTPLLPCNGAVSSRGGLRGVSLPTRSRSTLAQTAYRSRLCRTRLYQTEGEMSGSR